MASTAITCTTITIYGALHKFRQSPEAVLASAGWHQLLHSCFTISDLFTSYLPADLYHSNMFMQVYGTVFIACHCYCTEAFISAVVFLTAAPSTPRPPSIVLKLVLLNLFSSNVKSKYIAIFYKWLIPLHIVPLTELLQPPL